MSAQHGEERHLLQRQPTRHARLGARPEHEEGELGDDHGSDEEEPDVDGEGGGQVLVGRERLRVGGDQHESLVVDNLGQLDKSNYILGQVRNRDRNS